MPIEFHIDPITIMLLLIGLVGGWYTLKNNSTWHGEWIKKHSEECDERERTYMKLFTELQVGNAHLSEIVESNKSDVRRIDAEVLRVRDRTHDLGDDLQAIAKVRKTQIRKRS